MWYFGRRGQATPQGRRTSPLGARSLDLGPLRVSCWLILGVGGGEPIDSQPMGIVDIFSKRQRRLRGDVPDVYQYADLPVPFRWQVIHILRDVLGDTQAYQGNVVTQEEWYQNIHDILARELGVPHLNDAGLITQKRVFNFLLEADVENALSVIEVSFQVARTAQQDPENHYILQDLNMRFPEAVEELNARFQEHGIGYQFESNEIVRVDSQFLHQEAVRRQVDVDQMRV